MTLTMTANSPDCRTSRARSDALELGPLNGSVPSARLHVRAILEEWGYGELKDSAETVVAELVANSVEAHQREHRDEPVRLVLLAALRTLLIVVRDASNAPPMPATPDEAAERGRGLLMVEAFCSTWSWKLVPGGGKVVRALIRGQRR